MSKTKYDMLKDRWKRPTAILCLLPIAWLALDLTGLRFGDTVIVVSCFIDEPIDAFFWATFMAVWLLFIFKERLGKYALAICMVLWAGMQLSMYGSSQEGIASYNGFFAQEKTFYLLPPSDNVLVKDFYHSMLDVLLVVALISIVIYLTGAILHQRKMRTK
ncbi:MAG: hypothetical protein LBI64_04000 [Coriobacteriales bacterium]|nr:hypothetical protein [Coriobacteriales bacterium]